MAEPSLWQAVSLFTETTASLTDQDLDRPWSWGDYHEGIRFSFFRIYEELRTLAAELEREREQHLPLTTAQRALMDYHVAYRDLQAVLVGVSDALADRKPAPDEWSLRTVLLHIVEAERAFFSVIAYTLDRIRSEEEMPFAMPEEVWESFWVQDDFDQIQDNKHLSRLLEYYDQLHQRVLNRFTGVKDSELPTLALFWEDTPMSLQFRLHRFDSHLRQHTIQGEKTLVVLGQVPTEAYRLLRLMYNALARAEGITFGAVEVGISRRKLVAETIANLADEIGGVIP